MKRGDPFGHGTRACYVRERCTCGPCRQANSTYQIRLTRDTAYGRKRLVDAQAARDHIHVLAVYGLGDRRIAELAGLERKAVTQIRTGETRQIRKKTAEAIFSISDDPEVSAADSALIDATKTWRRIHALEALGYPKSWIAHRLGFHTRALQINKRAVTARNARAVQALAAEVGDAWGPSQRTRDRAEKLGYLDPAYYDEDWELLDEEPLDIPLQPVLEGREDKRAEIDRLLDLGLSSKVVAERVGVTVRTVERRRKRMQDQSQEVLSQRAS